MWRFAYPSKAVGHGLNLYAMSIDKSQFAKTEQESGDLSGPLKSRPWLTLLLFLGIAFAYMLTSVIAVMIVMAMDFLSNPEFDMEAWVESADSNGFLYATGTISGAAVLTPLTFACAFVMDRTSPLEYLGFSLPSVKSTVWSVLSILCFIAASDGLTWMLGREIVPPFMREVYLSAGHPAFFTIALVLGAPLVEEVVFRGFLYRGFIHTRAQFIGTAILTSLVWALLHTQYDLYAICTIFVGGLMLCYARHASQSIIPCLLMHSIMNLVATLEVAYVMAEQ